MDSQEELTLDFIDELLADPKTKVDAKKEYPKPVYTSTYIKTTHQEMRCLARGCGCPTYVLIKDEPFCTVHAIELMGNLLDEKINHYPTSYGVVEKILEAYLKLSEHPPKDEDIVYGADPITIHRTDHTEYVVMVGDKMSKYPTYTSPEGVLIQSLLDML